MSKFIFVTGGVISGLGKGVAAASLGRLLKARNYSIFVMKLDPYLNVDPGTMSPFEHGEVFVTKDGGETDLDLGHYERFTGTHLTKESNYTAGKIYSQLIDDERKGVYQGKTVQTIPHVTCIIEELILNAAKKSKADFTIVEIGGTVGDIESQPFIYALSTFASKHNEKSFFIHTTYVPFLEASKEFKSKPTQHSIRELRQFGINPNMVLLRANANPTPDIIDKVAFASVLEKDHVIGVPNADNVYKVPLFLENSMMAANVLKHFGLKNKKPNLGDWESFITKVDKKKTKKLNIAMIGKYVSFEDAYKSIIEAIKTSSTYQGVDVKFSWVHADSITDKNVKSKVGKPDGVVVLPGFGERGFNGKVIATTYLRETKIPTLGICYGMQAMTISQAKLVGIDDAISTENSKGGTPVIEMISELKTKKNFGGTLRLGEGTTIVKPGTKAHKIYGETALERHRHRYEVNPEFVERLETGGFTFSGFSKETGLAEIVEYKNHPFYIGVQYHPEFTSNPLTDHPLFSAFIKAAKK